MLQVAGAPIATASNMDSLTTVLAHNGSLTTVPELTGPRFGDAGEVAATRPATTSIAVAAGNHDFQHGLQGPLLWLCKNQLYLWCWCWDLC